MKKMKESISFSTSGIWCLLIMMGMLLLDASSALSAIDCFVCHGELTPDMHHLHVDQPVNSLIRPFPQGDNPDGTYACLSCHKLQSDPATGNAFEPFRNCTTCHSNVSNPNAMHHAKQWAVSGDCSYCHGVPVWATNMPKQAACRQCHINQNGFVQAADGNPPQVSHAFNTQGAIQDFGACLSCHLPVPFHGKPTYQPEWWEPAPGKGSFNIFWSEFRHAHPKEYWDDHNRPLPSPPYAKGISIQTRGYDDMKEFAKKEIKDVQDQPWSRAQVSFNWITIVHLNGNSYTVPTFDDISGGSTRPPLPTDPFIDYLSAGSGKPGNTISINGTNFGDKAGSNSWVEFGPVAASIKDWSKDKIDINVPHLPLWQSYSVTVVANGISSNTVTFYIADWSHEDD